MALPRPSGYSRRRKGIIGT
uniref:Uncharacterized protein n=1 Tax=Vitis vinifera TaxID=29760 RepID=F6HTG4_VITVI